MTENIRYNKSETKTKTGIFFNPSFMFPLLTREIIIDANKLIENSEPNANSLKSPAVIPLPML